MPETSGLLPVYSLLIFPFAAFLLLWLSGRRFNAVAGWVGASITLVGLLLLLLQPSPEVVQVLDYPWLRIGDRVIALTLRFDSLGYLMLVVVHFVALLVQVYSTSYLKQDPHLHRYFAFIQLFLFSMLGIVLSGNLLLMYIFWELVGLSSYLLIGFWYQKPKPVWAAQKAFVLNRIGDAAFLTGILLLIYYTGSTDLDSLTYSVATIPPAMMTVIGICLFGGCMGKSAQFPLSGWLPDAMEGPTPVSALIHAATMVAAGIFLLARIVFLLTPDAQLFIVIIGSITMVIGAVQAMFAWDIKRVLAFSTMSQLGLMVAAVGLGSWQMAIFHLVTHAFFKAGLFLSAGSVIHAMHADAPFDPQDMRNMGGLRRKLPITFICYTLCAASLAGLPFFSGFLSKDAIITEGFLNASNLGQIGILFPVLILMAAGLTAFYMFRQVWLVFFGKPRYEASAHPHESSMAMWLPMVLLTVLSFFWWFSLHPFDAGHGWFLKYLGLTDSVHLAWVPWVASSVSALALLMGYLQTVKTNPFGLRHKDDKGLQWPSWLRDYSETAYFIKPFETVFIMAAACERRIIDGLVNLLSKATVVGAHLIAWWDRLIVDGLVHMLAGGLRQLGNGVRSLQNGKIQSYFLVTATGMVLLLLWLFLVL
ncbi:NADH-quinone oxidoreductase subunit L [Dyadobacter jejuensis]|uniref:NADH-quinone oxidoreductase subunit L n=1 Tax=Dyadobacter jejuensis TaxID=1082580 RepID=A0A316AIN5_9BACT|nr:NADH-quinone oxidoreductase subunit L [Dyadobacter jejuensis]PWJ57583.1 NADH-quinone oxidoreductase subunit L [Dyadobacter jejuensis]